MKSLKLLILIFFIAVSIPLAFVIWQTYSGLEQEEQGQLRFFSETLFDQMEKELADLVEREENRAVDEYRHTMVASDEKGSGMSQLSPLAQLGYQEYILGYLQNNPDGSFQTPVVADMGKISAERRALVAQLKEVNTIFNQKKYSKSQSLTPSPPIEIQPVLKKKSKASFSDRYLTQKKSAPKKTYLGKKQKRVEEITAEQAYNIASEEKVLGRPKKDTQMLEAPASVSRPVASSPMVEVTQDSMVQDIFSFEKEVKEELPFEKKEINDSENQFQVEVAPFQSVSIGDDQVYIFRRIAINNQIYRQGFILLVEPLLRHLITTHFRQQPLAGYTALQMQRRDLGEEYDIIQAGIEVERTDFIAERVFPPPFDFISVTLSADTIPSSPARRSLNVALGVLVLFMILGLITIYQSARTIVAMSERRSQFVSSVTHELKTPLTNIRMYIEMLEQGIAATPEREQEYFAILGSESARLSGLINNVLELAKLEKKQRLFHMRRGQLGDVLSEVETVMSQKLKQEGFVLVTDAPEVPEFSYDREVLIQVLINLIENSVKFGKHVGQRQITIKVDSHKEYVRLAVSDTGPGIPRYALKKVFDDFYRVDNDLTRSTGGTGIGLALVKKFISAMGGRVEAANNSGDGCTVTLFLPLSPPSP